MSLPVNGAEQLSLPFDAECTGASTAKIISLEHHRQRAYSAVSTQPSDVRSNEEISKALERQILDEVLAEAEKLPWYK